MKNRFRARVESPDPPSNVCILFDKSPAPKASAATPLTPARTALIVGSFAPQKSGNSICDDAGASCDHLESAVYTYVSKDASGHAVTSYCILRAVNCLSISETSDGNVQEESQIKLWSLKETDDYKNTIVRNDYRLINEIY